MTDVPTLSNIPEPGLRHHAHQGQHHRRHVQQVPPTRLLELSQLLLLPPFLPPASKIRVDRRNPMPVRYRLPALPPSLLPSNFFWGGGGGGGWWWWGGDSVGRGGGQGGQQVSSSYASFPFPTTSREGRRGGGQGGFCACVFFAPLLPSLLHLSLVVVESEAEGGHFGGGGRGGEGREGVGGVESFYAAAAAAAAAGRGRGGGGWGRVGGRGGGGGGGGGGRGVSSSSSSSEVCELHGMNS